MIPANCPAWGVGSAGRHGGAPAFQLLTPATRGRHFFLAGLPRATAPAPISGVALGLRRGRTYKTRL